MFGGGQKERFYKIKVKINCLSVASYFSDSLSPIKVVLLASTSDSRKQSIAMAPRGLIDNLRRRYPGYLFNSVVNLII